MNHLKTFEQFEYTSTDEMVDEGLIGALTGWDWYKKNWKIAFGFYKAMGSASMMKKIAKTGTMAEQLKWKTNPQIEQLTDTLDKVKGYINGKTIDTLGGGSSHVQVILGSLANVKPLALQSFLNLL